MKRMKKLFAILMTMAMVMGLGITGFAAETTNVTVTVDNEYDSFYYLQIVESDTTSTLGWKYVDEYASNFDGVTVQNLIDIAKAEGSDNKYAKSGNIKNTDAYTSSQLAEKLEDLRDDIIKANNKIDNPSKSFSATKGGLYVVLPEKANYTYSQTLVYVPVNSTTSITVKAKGASDQVKKELVNVTGGEISGSGDTIVDGDDSVTANDTVEYKVTVKYPYFSDGVINKTFTIKDTLTNGTFLTSPALQITVDGKTYSNYTVSDIEEGTTEIIITFNDYNSSLAGKDVVLTYSVKVNGNVTSENKFSNKVESTIGTNKTQSIVKSDTVGVTFKKVDSETNKALEGAVFALYEKGTSDTLIAIIADAGKDDTVTLPEGYDDSKLVKDGAKDGTLSYKALDANKQYYVQEIVAPDGYQLVDTKFNLQAGGNVDGYPKTETTEIEGISTTTTEYQYNDFTVSDGNNGNGVKNTTLSALPSTGGMGTTLFTIAGCVIMISAAGLFFATRKKAN